VVLGSGVITRPLLLVKRHLAPRNPPATARPMPHLIHGGPAAPAAVRRWAASVECCTTCSARLAGLALDHRGRPGRWVKGARAELRPKAHPFRIPFHELKIGDTSIPGA